jgi:hypothetical protein
MKPEDLKTWLQAKKAAQAKLRDHISDAAQFLGTGENTIPDWIELQKASAIIQQQPEQVIANEAAPVAQQPIDGNTDVPDSASFTEGQTATGPDGQKAVFTNGQWVVQ